MAEYHSWVIPFYLAAGIYAVGAVAWLAIDPTIPVENLGRGGFATS